MFGRTTRRLAASAALAGGLVLGSGAGAWAHECYNASRSEQGNAMAGSRSQAWFTLVVADAVHGDAENGVITHEQAACILAAYEEAGGPASFTFMVKGARGQDGLIAGHNPNHGLMADGRGIDHAFLAYGEIIFGSYAACGVEF